MTVQYWLCGKVSTVIKCFCLPRTQTSHEDTDQMRSWDQREYVTSNFNCCIQDCSVSWLFITRLFMFIWNIYDGIVCDQTATEIHALLSIGYICSDHSAGAGTFPGIPPGNSPRIQRLFQSLMSKWLPCRANVCRSTALCNRLKSLLNVWKRSFTMTWSGHGISLTCPGVFPDIFPTPGLFKDLQVSGNGEDGVAAATTRTGLSPAGHGQRTSPTQTWWSTARWQYPDSS